VTSSTVRAPRYRRWVSTGALLGIAVGLLLAAFAGDDREYGFGTVALYLGLLGTLVGGVAGGAVALLVDRPAARAARKRSTGESVSPPAD
jgi:hypothetical protein